MNTETRIQKLLTADPGTLARIDNILNGGETAADTPTDRRLLSMTQAAETLGLSRQTIWRMTKENRLPVVEIRRGRFRIPNTAISQMIEEARASQ